MAPRILDPDRFILAGAVVDWTLAARRHNAPVGPIAERRRVGPAVVQLRWMLDPKLGLPTQAFQVWQRPRKSAAAPAPVGNLASYSSFAGQVYAWDPPQVFVRGTSAGAVAIVVAYAGAPWASAIVGVAQFAAGSHSFSFSGPQIVSLVVFGAATVSNLAGYDGASAANDPAWKPIELVGLPVEPAQWAGVFHWDRDQGLTGAPMKPINAALDRYRRGAPFFGWDDLIEPGHPAPPWVEADPVAIVKTMLGDVLPDLHTMIASNPPDQQINFRVNHALPLQGGGSTAKTNFSPVSTLMLGIASDPLASLIAGFGTAYTHVPEQIIGTQVDPTISPFDFMVSAFFERGLDGASAAAEYAAIVFAPSRPLPPAKPANLGAALDGLASPAALDARYRALVRLSWDQIPQQTPFRIASYAAARYGMAPPSPTQSLMGSRKLDPPALQPVSATTSQQVAEDTDQIRATDGAYGIDPAAAPNILRYGVAHQDICGVWSTWATADAAPQEPKAQQVRLLSARLDSVVPAAGSVCDAILVLDLSWDWTVRSPRLLRLAGRLYAAAKPELPPADLSLPAGLQTGFPGGAGAPLVITFTGGAAGSVPGAVLAYVSDDAKSVQASPVIVAGPRRYRLTVPGFKLDFAAAGHVGLALWAQGPENLAPQRAGDWSAEPLVISASDPRPPIVTALHEDVQLASLADARGEHRLRLAWSALPGATGYFVYQAAESKFRIAGGLGEAPASLSLRDRLLALRNAFEAKPLREPFTRINSTATATTSMEALIPRGSKEIHLYLVLGTSAGQVESAWPSLADPDRRKRFSAFAAPQVVPPSPVRLELARTQVSIGGVPTYRARVTMTTRPGAPVVRIDLHRVRVPEASLELDTMGPPVARITGPDPVWQVVPAAGAGPGEAQALGAVTGLDNPGGSWKRVYYRAVAVSGDDPLRGHYGGRSQPSGAAWVVVPPDGPPDLSPPVTDFPGPPGTVRFTLTSTAPVPPTDLGPHLIRVEAFSMPANGSLLPLFAWPPSPPGGVVPDASLAAVPTAPAPAPALWRESIAGGSRFRILLLRPNPADAVRLRVVLTDPLGRITERLLDNPALPAPDIISPVAKPSPPGRYILAFTTGAPFTAALGGPYVLTVSAAWTHTVSNPHPPPPMTTTTNLPSIAPIQAGNDPFTDPLTIPLRHSGNQVLVFLRLAATVNLTLTSPDGQTAHATVGAP